MDKKPVKIVVLNSHAGNRGDEAAQRSMIHTLGQMIPEGRFTVLTVSPRGLELQGHVEVLETISTVNRSFPVFHLPGIVVAVLLRKTGMRFSFLEKRFGLLRAVTRIAEADIVISAPGGPYFGDLYRRGEIGEHLLCLFIAKLFRKPVIIYGMSIGPFRIRWRNIIRRYLLNKVEVITLRDPISRDYLEDLKLTGPVIRVTADSAFQGDVTLSDSRLNEVMAAEIGPHGDRPLVGITPTGARWNFPGSDNAGKLMADYTRTIAAVVDHVVEQYKAVVVFFPQLYGRSTDMPLIEKIIDQTNSSDSIRVLSNRLNSQIQQAVISQMDLMIGNRYHSAIFAIKSCVPTVCISYEHKSAGVMKEIGMEDFMMDIRELTYEGLVEKIDAAWLAREDIKMRLSPGVERLRQRSRLNSLMVKALANTVLKGQCSKDRLVEEISTLMEESAEGN